MCKQQSPKKDATAKGLLTAMDTPDLGITAQKALQAVGGLQGIDRKILQKLTDVYVYIYIRLLDRVYIHKYIYIYLCIHIERLKREIVPTS